MKIKIVDRRTGRTRKSDWTTSNEGAESVSYRAGTQKAKLLAIYADHPRGLTDEEAAEYAGLLKSCYWKRCGELRQDGMIEPNGQTRPGDAQVSRIVCVLTDRGRNAL